MHFQSFHSAWKEHKPVVSEPLLQPKHVVLAPQPTPDASLVVPFVQSTPFMTKAQALDRATTQKEVDVGTVSEMQPETKPKNSPLAVLTSPWMSVALAAVLVFVFVWGLSCSMEVGRLTKQQNQLMMAILETLQRN